MIAMVGFDVIEDVLLDVAIAWHGRWSGKDDASCDVGVSCFDGRFDISLSGLFILQFQGFVLP